MSGVTRCSRDHATPSHARALAVMSSRVSRRRDSDVAATSDTGSSNAGGRWVGRAHRTYEATDDLSPSRSSRGSASPRAATTPRRRPRSARASAPISPASSVRRTPRTRAAPRPCRAARRAQRWVACSAATRRPRCEIRDACNAAGRARGLRRWARRVRRAGGRVDGDPDAKIAALAEAVHRREPPRRRHLPGAAGAGLHAHGRSTPAATRPRRSTRRAPRGWPRPSCASASARAAASCSSRSSSTPTTTSRSRSASRRTRSRSPSISTTRGTRRRRSASCSGRTCRTPSWRARSRAASRSWARRTASSRSTSIARSRSRFAEAGAALDGPDAYRFASARAKVPRGRARRRGEARLVRARPRRDLGARPRHLQHLGGPRSLRPRPAGPDRELRVRRRPAARDPQHLARRPHRLDLEERQRASAIDLNPEDGRALSAPVALDPDTGAEASRSRRGSTCA